MANLDVSQYLLILVGHVFTAGGVYGALRSDLKHMHEKIAAQSAELTRANQRIDNHLEGHIEK